MTVEQILRREARDARVARGSMDLLSARTLPLEVVPYVDPTDDVLHVSLMAASPLAPLGCEISSRPWSQN
jgi:hypothetical protein